MIAVSLALMIALSGCSWFEHRPERLQTELKIITPDIPELKKLPGPPLNKIKVKKCELADGTFMFCAPKSDIALILDNQKNLQKQIKNYEKLIDLYNEFYIEYQKSKK
jgi:hypothetical protein